MQCRYTYKTKYKRINKCKQDHVFIYCKEHWKIKLKDWIPFYFKLKKVHKIIWWCITGILAAYSIYVMVKDLSSDSHIKGKILPIDPQNTKYYNIDLGAKVTFPIQTLELTNGYSLVNLPGFMCIPVNPNTNKPEFNNVIWPSDLQLKIKKNKLYLTVTIKDLNGDIIGRLKDNYWEIKPNKITESHDGSNHFEILDGKGNVAFRLEVDEKSVIHIRGYFINTTCAAVLTDKGMNIIQDSKSVIDSLVPIRAKQNIIKYCKFYKND